MVFFCLFIGIHCYLNLEYSFRCTTSVKKIMRQVTAGQTNFKLIQCLGVLRAISAPKRWAQDEGKEEEREREKARHTFM